MLKIIMNGCGGVMGQIITGLAAEDSRMEVVAGVDIRGSQGQSFPVYPSIWDCTQEADVVIDFSAPQAVDSLLDYCEKKKMPVVLCTTGLSPEQIARAEEISGSVPVLRSANMSLGINLLLGLVAEAARVLSASDFDIEIVEKHHRRKKDAPSGTALMLANAVNQALENSFHYTYDRSDRNQPRDPKEIGISAVRGGTIVGEHDVIFAGTDEVVTISHTAYSRAVFAKGALAAAVFLAGQEPGMYDMADVIGL